MAQPAATTPDEVYASYVKRHANGETNTLVYWPSTQSPIQVPLLSRTQFDKYTWIMRRGLYDDDTDEDDGPANVKDFELAEDRVSLVLKNDKKRSLWAAAQWFKIARIGPRGIHLRFHQRYDIVAWKKRRVARVIRDYSFSTRVRIDSTVILDQACVLFNVEVLLDYDGVSLVVGRIGLARAYSDDTRLFLAWFESKFKTNRQLAIWLDLYFGNVQPAGIMTSALYWLVYALMTPGAHATINVNASTLIGAGTRDHAANQERLQEHYESMGFELVTRRANPYETGVEMECSLYDFMEATADLVQGVHRFVYKNAMH